MAQDREPQPQQGFLSSIATGLDAARERLVDETSRLIERGKVSRGGSSNEAYVFGDFTRGLTAGPQVKAAEKYGTWGRPEEAVGEFGPPLRPIGFETGPLSSLADGSSTVYEALQKSCQRFPDNPAVGSRKLLQVHQIEENGKKFEKLQLENVYNFINYKRYMDCVKHFASGLVLITGLPAGSRLVIYAETQQDWMVAALAAFSMSIEVVTIYATLGEQGASYGINQTGATVCVADAKLLKVLMKIAPQCPQLKHVITMTPCDDAVKYKLQESNITTKSFAEVSTAGFGGNAEPRPPSAAATAVVMYTSGTTGAPKGVLISHGNLAAAVAGFHHAASGAGVYEKDVFLAYLPLAHIMEMVAEISVLALGASMGYGSPHTLIDSGVKLKRPESEGDATLLKPTFMVFAPAVLDKVYKGVLAKVEKAGGASRWFFGKALEIGMMGYDGGGIGVNPLYNMAFQSVQAALGGQIQYAITGSAPLSPEIQRFMQTVLKAPVRQGYGLTENCACATLGAKDDNAVKSVGAPTACTVIRLADWPEGGYKNSDKDDPRIGMRRGEVLVGGPTVCMGYFVDEHNPDPEIQKKNAEEFVEIAGVRYFRTGDIGQVCPNGTLQIIDRKKDLWKGPQGEYVALSKVEAALKLSPYVDMSMAYGKTGGDYPVALLCVAENPVKQFAEAQGLPAQPIADLCKAKPILDEVMSSCKAMCKEAGLVEFEVPKRIALLPPRDGAPAWSPENDMLTAAQKLKRPNIVRAFAAEIDALYA